MRPILVPIPAKLLFFVALAVALGFFVRDLVQRRRNPKLQLSATPLYLLGAAEVLLWKRSDSWIPSAEAFGLPWAPVPIYSYGVMLGTSLVVGWFLVMRLAQQDHIDQQEAGTMYMWTAVWSIIGSRILWFITDTDHPDGSIFDLFKVWQGGLVAYGGMIGGFLASWYCCRKRKIPLLQWADVVAPGVVLGTGITRIGCLLFGCDYGARTSLPWGLSFPKGSPAWNHHVFDLLPADLRLPRSALWSYPVHPTQIYESLAGFLLFGLLMLIRRYRRFSGQVFLGWVLGYGIMRPLIELVRDDEDRGLHRVPFTANAQISTSQFIGIASVVLGLALLVALVRRYRRDPESLRLWQHAPALAPAAATAGGTTGHPAPAPQRRKRR